MMICQGVLVQYWSMTDDGQMDVDNSYIKIVHQHCCANVQ